MHVWLKWRWYFLIPIVCLVGGLLGLLLGRQSIQFYALGFKPSIQAQISAELAACTQELKTIKDCDPAHLTVAKHLEHLSTLLPLEQQAAFKQKMLLEYETQHKLQCKQCQMKN